MFHSAAAQRISHIYLISRQIMAWLALKSRLQVYYKYRQENTSRGTHTHHMADLREREEEIEGGDRAHKKR